jgi:DNA ligase-1
MTFKRLSEYFGQLEKTSSRNEKIRLLAQALKEADEEEVDKICYLALGRLAPLYVPLEFQLAEKMMIRIIAQAFGEKEEEVKREYKKRRDLGEVGEKYKIQNTKYKIQNLTVGEVYERLMGVAKESGEGSQERKIQKMGSLLRELDGLSVRYVARIPLGRLRLGFLDLTILDALSVMLAGDKTLRPKIEGTYNVRADIGEVAKKLKIKNEKLKITGEEISPQPGVPVMPALCQRLPSPEEMMKKMMGPAYASDSEASAGKLAVEPKFDGTRLQVHLQKPKTKNQKPKIDIFTRNLENVTAMFPDIVRATSDLIQDTKYKIQNTILDGEAIGMDPKTGKFLPFQETIKRKRKYEVGQKAKEIPLVYFVFDILYKDGQNLLGRPFFERRKILEETGGGLPAGRQGGGDGGVIRLTPQVLVESAEELRRIHDEYVARGLEGVVVKKLDAPYEPGRRGFTWVKYKEEVSKKGGGLADTLDCLVMGYYKGRGKRAGFGIGAFLVGVIADKKVGQVGQVEQVEKGSFVTVSKIGTGLTDEQWRELKLKIKNQKLKTAEKPEEYRVDKNLFPDVWVAPGLVAEIQADNITISPIHSAGYALRFPRLVRFRPDKGPEQVSTLAEVERLYKMQ